MSRSARVPLTLDTATIEPPIPASIMALAPARMTSQVPVRLTSRTRRQSSGACSSSSPDAPMPAHEMTRSGVPTVPSVCAIAAETESGSLMSQAMSPPVRSHTTMDSPALRSRVTTAAPIPDAPPVTTAVTRVRRSTRHGRRPDR